MIAKLRGTVAHVGVTNIVIDVAGVGYHVSVSSVRGFAEGEEVSLFTHLAVRENALDLYGFQSEEERTMFENLIKLPKIGPKTAMQILSQVDLPTLRKAVAAEDPSYLSKMSGIGKKSAEKIVSGLKDLLEDEAYTGSVGAGSHADSDVIDALLTLGYSERDAREAVQKIPEEVVGTNARVKHALKEVGK